MNKLTGLVRRCIEDYSMISEGDRIAVGVSGGKDSLALLCALADLRRYYPQRFELTAITVAMGFDGMDFSEVGALCRRIGVPYILKESNIKKVVFDDRREKNPCALCAKMRRGILHDVMRENGLRKIALGHHYDDAVETFMLSLFYEGRIGCFQPVTYMSRAEVTQIRPLLYVGEATVAAAAERCRLPVVHNPCAMNGESRREEMKVLLAALAAQYPDLKGKVFGAIQRSDLRGWRPETTARRPLP